MFCEFDAFAIRKIDSLNGILNGDRMEDKESMLHVGSHCASEQQPNNTPQSIFFLINFWWSFFYGFVCMSCTVQGKPFTYSKICIPYITCTTYIRYSQLHIWLSLYRVLHFFFAKLYWRIVYRAIRFRLKFEFTKCVEANSNLLVCFVYEQQQNDQLLKSRCNATNNDHQTYARRRSPYSWQTNRDTQKNNF